MTRETAIGIVADRLENHRSAQRWDMGGRWEKAEAIVDALGIGQPQADNRDSAFQAVKTILLETFSGAFGPGVVDRIINAVTGTYHEEDQHG